MGRDALAKEMVKTLMLSKEVKLRESLSFYS
jgi:hypothetical protein